MTAETRKLAFWETVEQCLIAFHGMPDDVASQRVRTLRKRLSPRALALLYHEEPFYTACDLAGKELNIADFIDKYDHILRETGR